MMTLSDFGGDVRAIADAEAFGVMLNAPGGRARLVTRHRAGVAAHLLPCDRLPAVLNPSIAALTIITPLSSHGEASHPVVDRLLKYGIDCVAVMPLPGNLGVFWTGKRDASPFSHQQLAPLESLAARVAASILEPETRERRLARLSRIDAVEQVLPIIAGALDVRDVFQRLSEVSRTVIAHDAATIQLLSEDHTQLRMYALDGIPREGVPETFSTMYAPLFNEHFQFSIHDDLLGSPAERHRPSAKAGLRSALRLPLRIDGRIGGTLEFCSLALGVYNEADVSVGQRIADYVALTMAHQRMDEDARRAAALRERSDNLLLLDDLLATLAGVLDVRQVFDRVSVIAQKVLPHDAMTVTQVLESADRIRLLAISGFSHVPDFPETFESVLPEPALLTEPWDYRIIDDFGNDVRYAESPTVKAGMQSVLGLPVRLDGRLAGGVNFYRRSKAAFTRDDVFVGRRIADHLALTLSHQRLSEQARSNEELRAQSANLELLDGLLAALTDTGELKDVFDRISDISRRVLPHDAVSMPVVLPDGQHARRYATAGFDVAAQPDVIPIPAHFAAPGFEHDLVEDASLGSEPLNVSLAARGFRSALRVPIRLDGRLAAGLSFMSRTPGVYKQGDILIAHRIADRLALYLSRERGAEASKRADEASARASRLESRVNALTEELDARTGYRRVVGASAPWRQVLTQATQVASTDTTVLLLGESGTGKEVVARFLHRASARTEGPFIALNCAALPEQLLEAELFGYERGAFTGATQAKPGQLEQAAGGTLFLDEVGEMSPPAQAKFLRVLQEREFQRLGGTRVLRTDARVVAATNRDLQRAMKQGTFREDLFYRLNVFAIHLPPLRDRPDDILPMSEAFLAEYGRGLGRPPAGISRDAGQMLLEYQWPGNVRELRNILERAAILCDGGLITAEHLALKVDAARPRQPTIPDPPAFETSAVAAPPPASAGDLQSIERRMIEQALQNARFNKSKAAQELGLTRAQLYVRMKRHGLE
jgi:transcriptional regulator with GAF, ATPase, and Fis domain